MRILGLDYGDKTIGVAISCENQLIAFGLKTLFRDKPESLKKSLRELKDLAKKYDVEVIVLGYPKNMDNTEGERCAKTILFKDRLEKNIKNTKVILHDERLSTVYATDRLKEMDLDRKKIETVVDEMAAIYILQGYLDKIHNNR